jgi:hypothetical protein
MIISGLHKFIFVAIPKTGTHSVRQALREHMGTRDLEQVGLFVQKRFPIPELAQLQHGHLSLHQVRPYLRPRGVAVHSSSSPSFVTHSIRFISYWAFRTRGQDLFERDPQKASCATTYSKRRPTTSAVPAAIQFVTGDDGQLLTDYVGRVERMQESYDEIAGKIGISPPRSNGSTRPSADYRDYYDQQLIDGVARAVRSRFGAIRLPVLTCIRWNRIPRKTESIRGSAPSTSPRCAQAVLALPEAVWDAENAAKPNRSEPLMRPVTSFSASSPTFVDWRRLL